MGEIVDRARHLRAYIEKAAQSGLTDQEALQAQELYPAWDKLIGVTVKDEDGEFRFIHDNKLCKLIAARPHTFQKDWVPGVGTESLYVFIDEDHAGTLDAPIHYDGNMVLSSGRYYTQGTVVYLCIRDTGNPVYQPLSELVGLYVEVVE